ncbi:SDR family oxidoreductase [Pseudogracilibacillus auburnensis]|uniref:NADP-dependent 3-hydroxy acid dehydrogenase YdfG n=1 Tax=Pseudogracilibacillus auburnensis TaxID=1494959 RepID=A0A2V3W1U1_9BACI|nr:SDR family oxidoreductase [Pseudogracilibacillus auburnensis]PXW87061.1 NADP-dependent 3-hydroxy acid dehydrogenase YdfG [Pseudogracilibacillus auburnensis]
MTKTAIVTGASSGIGKAIAMKLAEENINVVLVARSEDKLTTLAKEINNKEGANALAIPTDVSKREEVEKMVKEAKKQFGSIDVYINNAGLMLSAAVTDGQINDWEQMIDVNMKGVLYGIHAVVPEMKERKTGHLINIASVSGIEVTKKSTVYSATKFAVRAISMGLEKELAHTGVRVTNISPGMVDTNLTRRHTIQRKPLAPEDLANAVFYALTQPTYVNVNEITVRPV